MSTSRPAALPLVALSAAQMPIAPPPPRVRREPCPWRAGDTQRPWAYLTYPASRVCQVCPSRATPVVSFGRWPPRPQVPLACGQPGQTRGRRLDGDRNGDSKTARRRRRLVDSDRASEAEAETPRGPAGQGATETETDGRRRPQGDPASIADRRRPRRDSPFAPRGRRSIKWSTELK